MKHNSILSFEISTPSLTKVNHGRTHSTFVIVAYAESSSNLNVELFLYQIHGKYGYFVLYIEWA